MPINSKTSFIIM
ncbi:UNVERIFIED_CONTAM: hypothetical protein GTU68_061492 [Idotea baltica]|nr:hypothetical protein [Idotea baltica]